MGKDESPEGDPVQIPRSLLPHPDQIPSRVAASGSDAIARWQVCWAVTEAIAGWGDPQYCMWLYESDVPTGNFHIAG